MKSNTDKGLYRRRGSPYWWIRYADRNGRVHRRSTDTSSKKLAREILAKQRVLVAENRHLDVKKVPNTTFFELCDQYWELDGKHKRMKGLKNMIDIWKKQIGDLPVKELNQHTVEKFLTALMEERGVSGATRNRHLTMLKVMLNKGKKWRLITDNAAADIRRLRENGARTRFLDQEEIRQLLEAASDGFCPILIAALHTGMRRGEILNLKWVDVDFKNRIVTIQESKSGKKRMIPMDDTLYETLRVLPSRFQQGSVFSAKNFRKKFDAIRAKSGIQDFRFHDLRHTFASHLVMARVDIKTVQELLGHSSLAMTLRYSHLAPDHRLRAIKSLDKALSTAQLLHNRKVR